MRYQFETRRLIAVGYSNGANVAAAMMLVRPEVLPAAILLRAMAVLGNPPEAADLRGKRIFMSAGRYDSIIPLENAQRLANFLEKRGAAVTWETQESGHALVREDLIGAGRWLDL